MHLLYSSSYSNTGPGDLINYGNRRKQRKMQLDTNVVTWHKSSLDQWHPVAGAHQLKLYTRQSCPLAVELGSNCTLGPGPWRELEPCPDTKWSMINSMRLCYHRISFLHNCQFYAFQMDQNTDLMLPMLLISLNFHSALLVSSSHTPLGSLTMSVTTPSTGTDNVTFCSGVDLKNVNYTYLHFLSLTTNLAMECWLYL